MAGEKLRQRFSNKGEDSPTSRDACQELLRALELKGELTKCRLELLEGEQAEAPAMAMAKKAELTLITARLKSWRQSYKTYPTLRKKYRPKIARLYVKKLAVQAQLEKYNKPAMAKLKEEIKKLKSGLEDLQKLAAAIKMRMAML